MGKNVRLALLAVLGVSAAWRLWLCWNELGIYWPDEIYQSLEPAHRLSFGYGLRAWEFIDGARNWTFPALIAVVMKTASLLGMDAPERYLRLLRLLFSGLGVLTGWGVYRLALAYRVKPVLAISAAALFSLNAISLYFGHRAMSEVASLAPIIWGLVLVVEERKTRPTLWLALGASLLGLSVLIRLQNGLFCVGAVALLLEKKRWRDGAIAFGVLCTWALLLGLIDKLTWGGWYHSVVKYVQFNLVEGKGALWGISPFRYYADVAFKALQGPSLVLLLALPFAIRRAPALVLTCVAFVVFLSYQPHKEFRFVIPVLPVLCALAAVGIETLADLLSAEVLKTPLSVGLFALALVSASQARSLTFGQLGAYEGAKDNASAWGDFAPLMRLFLTANKQPDLCGMKLEASHMAWAGGQSYLHRSVNLYSHNGPPRETGYYNYVVTAPQWTQGLDVIASDGPFVLARFPNLTCRQDPAYNDRLP